MRERALIHVSGPAGAGKTIFVRRLLDAEIALAICVRAERDAKLRKEQESAPPTRAELRRYRDAGASAVALYRFAEQNTDAFFTSDFMQDYSEAVFIEGDCPIDYVDLSVFVAPAPAKGRSLLRRGVRDHTASHQASIDQLAHALENPEAFALLLGAGLGEPLVAMALKQPRFLDDLRRSMKSKLEEVRHAPPPAPTERWALEEGYAGAERAQLVVVNVRCDAERRAAEAFVDDIARLRKDEEVYRDVVGLRGNRRPVAAVIADLSNPKDAGLKKAVARVKRATKRRPQ
jgi:hypothetical protein